MKSISKTVKTTTSTSNSHASARADGISLTPPAYGIESVDRASAETVPVAEQQPIAGTPTQMKADLSAAGGNDGAGSASGQNRTGLPDTLKAGVESLSGLAMDDVHVHYNSSKPAQLHALAYTQGTDIHVGPGQERHLPHEAWHVVQQKQGRVRTTMQMKWTSINDDQGLEQEATQMGARASQTFADQVPEFGFQRPGSLNKGATTLQVVQRITEDAPGQGYIAMDHWGYRQLGDGESIGTDSMSTCVTLAIYNENHVALVAHFGSTSLDVNPLKDAKSGAAAIAKKIGELGGTEWKGWVFTGKKDHPISEKRIEILTQKLGFLEREKSPHSGITLTRNGTAITPTWIAPSKSVEALDLAF